jgi:hypothetical protein
VEQRGSRVPGEEAIATEPGKEAVMETKYACRACGHQWKLQAISS